MTPTHFIITVKTLDGKTSEINHRGDQDKRFLIGLYGLEERSEIESYSIRIAGTPLVYTRIKATAL